jgi:hypothetical protein
VARGDGLSSRLRAPADFRRTEVRILPQSWVPIGAGSVGVSYSRLAWALPADLLEVRRLIQAPAHTDKMAPGARVACGQPWPERAGGVKVAGRCRIAARVSGQTMTNALPTTSASGTKP